LEAQAAAAAAATELNEKVHIRLQADDIYCNVEMMFALSEPNLHHKILLDTSLLGLRDTASSTAVYLKQHIGHVCTKTVPPSGNTCQCKQN
jgi:hypothetical protein